MKNTISIIFLFLLLIQSFQLSAQEDRFFTPEEAIEWVPSLIGFNIQVIGEKNDQGIEATAKERIKFVFMTDTQEKSKALKAALKEMEGYELYKEYSLEGFWVLTGLTNEMSMQFDSFSEWTFEFCKTGLDYDNKLLTWSFQDMEQAAKIDKFWTWFKKNQDEFYNLDHNKMDELEASFEKLDKELKPLNPAFVFEFSPILENGKREFILSADGNKEAFPALLNLYKRSPELEKWKIIPFKQAFDGDPQLEFTNGYKFSWDKVMFESQETDEGLSIDFYIEDYDENDQNFDMGLIVLLDTYLGEYDAVMQIRYVEIKKLNRKKAKTLTEFKDLKEVVEAYKMKKNGR